jgi:hypothetical protein
MKEGLKTMNAQEQKAIASKLETMMSQLGPHMMRLKAEANRDHPDVPMCLLVTINGENGRMAMISFDEARQVLSETHPRQAGEIAQLLDGKRYRATDNLLVIFFEDGFGCAAEMVPVNVPATAPEAYAYGAN